MSLIGRDVSDFKVQAYVGDEFKEVTKNDIMGKWSVFFSTRQILLCVPYRVRRPGK